MLTNQLLILLGVKKLLTILNTLDFISLFYFHKRAIFSTYIFTKERALSHIQLSKAKDFDVLKFIVCYWYNMVLIFTTAKHVEVNKEVQKLWDMHKIWRRIWLISHLPLNSTMYKNLEVILQNRPVATDRTAVKIVINRHRNHKIIHNRLSFIKVCTQWVRKQLTGVHKANCMLICQY